GPLPDFDYGPGGYQEGPTNVGVHEATGELHFEIKGLVEPSTPEATRICREDLNEVITAFVQDRTALERGLFDEETAPQDLTQVRMGKIVRDRYPELSAQDQEAVRQHAVAALNLTQRAKALAMGVEDEVSEPRSNTALIDGVRKLAMDVRELDIDLIDSINPFASAYAVLARSMNENTLKQVQAAISAKRTAIAPDEAKDLAARAVKFKKERGRLPAAASADPWERRLAEGAAAFVRFKDAGRYD
ncbi:MAG: DEAD/DEAH box helicase, partial [Phenylobacterium sp.]